MCKLTLSQAEADYLEPENETMYNCNHCKEEMYNNEINDDGYCYECVNERRCYGCDEFIDLDLIDNITERMCIKCEEGEE